MPLRLLAPLILLPALLLACSSRDPATAPSDDSPGGFAAATAATTATASASPSARPPSATPGAALAVPGPAGHDGARTLEHIAYLANTIGPRVSGTDGEAAAVDYIAGQFGALGYDVEVMPFEFANGGFAVDSLSAGGVEIASRRFNGSGAAGDVSAEAVFVGLADAAGLAGKSLAGRIAIADRGDLTFTDKYAAVKAAGAVGLIVINDENALFAGRIDPPATDPVVGVSSADREALLAAAAAGETFTLDIPAFSAQNVIARPAAGAECRVLVGGHHDTVPDVPGATDNASGTATVLELARAFAVDGLDEGLCFATFGAEESGLHGSAALAERLRENGELPAVYLNLDVTGTGSRIEAIGNVTLAEEAVEIATGLGADARVATDPAGTSSDHASFIRAGVASLFLASNDFSTIHTPGDTVETLNPALLDEIGDVAYELIARYGQRFARG